MTNTILAFTLSCIIALTQPAAPPNAQSPQETAGSSSPAPAKAKPPGPSAAGSPRQTPQDTTHTEPARRCNGSSSARLQCAQESFQYGRYQEVVQALRDPIEQGRFAGQADLKEAMRIYGISLFLVGRKQAALLVFTRLSELAPTLRMDPRLVPPEVVQAYRSVRRKRLARRLHHLPKANTGSMVLNFLPPAGQFQNHQYVKASLILTAEVCLAAANATSWSILRSPKYRHDGSYVVQDAEGNIIEDHRTLAKSMLVVNYVSFALLIGTIIYGIVDGWVVLSHRRKAMKKRRQFLQQQLRASPSSSSGTFAMDF
ncbi:MAG: hypothetical protein J7M25_14355 [Deltaproteobacteria bacterium]|nr:hypothetical protein [Deltaproteobacteria bacterium]